MSSVSKGAQAEREAEAALQADGWLTYRVMRGGRKYMPIDIFSCIDIVAKKEGVPFTRWVQVTAAASWTHKLTELLTVPWSAGDVVEVWHRKKGHGRHFAVFQVFPPQEPV
jgi:hypothetical protein